MVRRIAVIPGDGIGPEIIRSTLAVLKSAGFQADYDYFDIGQKRWREKGTSYTEDDTRQLRAYRAILKGPINSSGMDKSPTVRMRKALGIYKIIRPVESLPTSPEQYGFVIFREGSEGLYSGDEEETVKGEEFITRRKITRRNSELLFRDAFEYAISHELSRVVCISKKNVVGSDKFLYEIFLEVAGRYTQVRHDHMNIDECIRVVAHEPKKVDGYVLATENSYGDYLSSPVKVSEFVLGSANIGENHGIFEPVSGSADDIAGQNIANPIGAMKAGCYLLEYLGQEKTSRIIQEAIKRAIIEGKVLTRDMGGSATTKEFTDAVDAVIRHLA